MDYLPEVVGRKLYYSLMVMTACWRHGAPVRQAAACVRSKGVISVLRIMCIDSQGAVVGQARSSQRASALVTCRCRALEALSPRSRKTRGVAQASRAEQSRQRNEKPFA